MCVNRSTIPFLFAAGQRAKYRFQPSRFILLKNIRNLFPLESCLLKVGTSFSPSFKTYRHAVDNLHLNQCMWIPNLQCNKSPFLIVSSASFRKD
jgi:hypothetical protein